MEQQQKVLHQLYLPVQCGGLHNLESLTIHLDRESLEETEVGQDFWSAAQIECPRLKNVRLTGLNKGEKFWLDDSGLL